MNTEGHRRKLCIREGAGWEGRYLEWLWKRAFYGQPEQSSTNGGGWSQVPLYSRPLSVAF